MNRARKSWFGEWWWTMDRLLLTAFLVLMGAGAVMSFAASPAVAARIGLDPSHFTIRHMAYLLPALLVILATSMLSPKQVRRVCLGLFIVFLAALAATLFIGVEIKGARRWIHLPVVGSFQPSEFLKPAFVVLVAWLMSERMTRPDVPGNLMAGGLLVIVAGLLVQQPDFGQTMLVVGVWVAMFFVASMPWIWVLVIGAGGAGLLGSAYLTLPHVASRINRFLSGTGDTYQTDVALEAISRGGWFGRGPGEGTVKRILPDSHTDFIFAVTAEEFGIIVCIVVVLVFGLVLMRGLWHALKVDDPFCRVAVTGLVTLFGFQSAINMAVNLHLVPAKGMTLPFISYGGSSMIAVAFSMGLVLALTRRRPRVASMRAYEPARPALAAPAGGQPA